MSTSKILLDNLAASGLIEPPNEMSDAQAALWCENLNRFAEYGRNNSEMLRLDLFSADSERIKRQLQKIKAALHSCGAFKLESNCDYILKHNEVRGPENCIHYMEKLLSDIIAFSIAIQMAQHQAQKDAGSTSSGKEDEQQQKYLLTQLQQALESFDGEKSSDCVAKLERIGLENKLDQIKLFIKEFEFDKAIKALADLKTDIIADNSSRKRIILAVDDIPQSLASLKAIIGDRCKFYGVVSGEAALKFLEMNIPDVFILDIDMPKMNGFQLVEAIRAKRKIAPIIFLTANATADYVTKAFELGITDFLVKPCNEEAVWAKLDSIFSTR
ncbi:MAG: response regulator [Thermoguttaceae bacterium]